MFIAFIIFSILAALWWLLHIKNPGWEEVPKIATKIVAWVFTGVAVLFLFFSCIKSISTKNVGIETTFGKTTGELSNGLHFTWPWGQGHGDGRSNSN